METFDMSKIVVGEGFSLTGMKMTDSEVVVSAVSTSASCCCPLCGTAGTKSAGTCTRRPQDLPVANKTTWLNLKARRYTCVNPACSIGSFAEPVKFPGRSARRTDRLDIAILATSVFMGADTTSTVLGWTGIKISHKGAEDLQKRCEFPDDSDVEHAGLDDFSTHKGLEYDSVLVAGEDHHVMMVIKGRDYHSVREMLKQFPRLKYINRDRDGTCARAIRDTNPDCEQIADPFHMTKNILDTFKDLFKEQLDVEYCFVDDKFLDEAPKKVSVLRVDPNSNKLAELNYDNTPVLNEQGETVVTSHVPEPKGREADALNKRVARLENILTVQQQMAGSNGIKYTYLAREPGLSPATVKTYSVMPEEQIAALREKVDAGLAEREIQNKRVPTFFDPLIYRALNGREAPETVYALCVRNGCTGPLTTMERHISDMGREHFGLGIQETGFATRQACPPEVRRVRRADILKYMTISDRSKMEKSNVARYYECLKEKYPIIATADATYREWHEIRESDNRETAQQRLDAFIEKHGVKDDIAQSFVSGLTRDYDAVLNGVSMKGNFTSSWVEGNNRKTKVAEATMYGRYKTPCLNTKVRLGSVTYKGTATIEDLYRRPAGRGYGPRKICKAA